MLDDDLKSRMSNNYDIFLEIAQEDYKSSIVLSNSELYPQSVFYFGQAIEKICKYLLIKEGVLPVEKLKSTISHNLGKVFTMFTDYIIGRLSQAIDKENILHNKDDKALNTVLNPIEFTEDLRSGIEDFKKQNISLQQLDEAKFYHYLSMLRYFDSSQNSQNKYSKLFSAEPRVLVEWLITYHILDEGDKHKYIEVMQCETMRSQFIAEVAKLQIDVFELMRINQILLVLALIFSSYDSVTRYPDYRLLSSPNMIFNSTSPIVINITELHGYLEKVINYLKP